MAAAKVKRPRPATRKADAAVAYTTDTSFMNPELAALWEDFAANATATSMTEPTRITRADYLKLIEGNVDFFKQHQDEHGAIIDPYKKIEWQYSTPAFALSAATLVKYGNRQDLLEPAAKAMDWACETLSQGKAAQRHDHFYFPMLAKALPILRPLVAELRVKAWEKNLEASHVRHGGGNWDVVALSGDALLYYQGLRKDLSWAEDSLEYQLDSFTSWGNYVDHGSPAMAYDHFPRMWLALMLASGYSGRHASQVADTIRCGAYTSLFMQSPWGELPAGGRSAHHQWNEAEQCVTYEIYAMFSMAQGDRTLAGMFKRAAHLAFQSMRRWQRPSGEMWIVKNRMDPEKFHGYMGYSSHSQYNLLPMAMLSIAYEYAVRSEGAPERLAPADVGGYVLDLRDQFHKVIANCGANYIEIETSGDMAHNPTGLIRFQGRKSNPQIGPSDGLAKHDNDSTLAAVGISWRDGKGNWRRLAEFNATSVPQVILKREAESPERVAFQLTYMGGTGVSGIVEHYDLTPEQLQFSSSINLYGGPCKLVWPVLVDNGSSQPTVTVTGKSVRVELDGAIQTFTAPDAESVTLTDEKFYSPNGWAKLAEAYYSKALPRMTLVITPGPGSAQGPSARVSNLEDPFDPEYMKSVMKSVFRYTVAHPRRISNGDWERGALYTGIMAAGQYLNDNEYIDQAMRWGEQNKWQFNFSARAPFHADNQCAGQAYTELYMLKGGEEKIAYAKKQLNDMISSPPQGRVEWWWCDALYMAPPMFVRLAKATGDNRYIDLMNQMYWDTKDFLYDKDEHLFYRDASFFGKKTANGKKVFWSRGNGWVMGGLARVLQYLPNDNAKRTEFIELYRQMSEKLASLQGRDGMWRTSLLDPEEFPMPETSGTGFYTFAMAWGINNGLLDREKYLPVVKKGWEGLCRCVHEDGKLGWVQHVAGGPGLVSPDMLREYAAGAFLLAGCEVMKLGGR